MGGGGGDESLVEKNKNLVGGSLLDGGIFLIEGDGNFRLVRVFPSILLPGKALQHLGSFHKPECVIQRLITKGHNNHKPAGRFTILLAFSELDTVTLSNVIFL